MRNSLIRPFFLFNQIFFATFAKNKTDDYEKSVFELGVGAGGCIGLGAGAVYGHMAV